MHLPVQSKLLMAIWTLKTDDHLPAQIPLWRQVTIDIENGQLEINIIMISDPMRAVAREDIVTSVDNDGVVIYPDDRHWWYWPWYWDSSPSCIAQITTNIDQKYFSFISCHQLQHSSDWRMFGPVRYLIQGRGQHNIPKISFCWQTKLQPAVKIFVLKYIKCVDWLSRGLWLFVIFVWIIILTLSSADVYHHKSLDLYGRHKATWTTCDIITITWLRYKIKIEHNQEHDHQSRCFLITADTIQYHNIDNIY